MTAIHHHHDAAAPFKPILDHDRTSCCVLACDVHMRSLGTRSTRVIASVRFALPGTSSSVIHRARYYLDREALAQMQTVAIAGYVWSAHRHHASVPMTPAT